MADQNTGFEAGLNWLDSNDFSPDEKHRLLEWYRDTHGTGSLELVKFVPFLAEHDPGSLKRYRRHVEAIAAPLDGDALPQAAVGLLFLHLYSVIANERGALYEVIASREWGATKAEVLETIAFAFSEAGPHGMNAVAELAGDYLSSWTDDGSSDAIEWPSGWAPNPEVFCSGIDLDTDDLAPGELDVLADWNRRMFGEDDPNTALLAGLHPRAYKAYRIRYERAMSGGALPAQIFPLFALHLAIIQGRALAMKRAARMAQALGVCRYLAVQTVWWGLLYGGTTLVETVSQTLGPLLAEWDA